jgi:hypothetical protein
VAKRKCIHLHHLYRLSLEHIHMFLSQFQFRARLMQTHNVAVTGMRRRAQRAIVGGRYSQQERGRSRSASGSLQAAP